jgi:DnaJ-class molecular chaperone
MSYYDTLEVPKTATIDEIKKSYRKLSLKYHPDRNPGRPDMVSKFQEIGEAYEVLGDEQKKEEYDMMQNSPFAGGKGNIDELFSNLFGMNFASMRPMDHMDMSHMGMGGPMGMGMGGISINGIPFGGPGIRIFRQGQPVHQKPAPITKTLVISMEQVLDGAIVPIEIERWLIENDTKMYETETLYVTIPKGVDDNEIIVLKDKGNFVAESCIGDLKIVIKVNNEGPFERYGLDLLFHKTISLKESLCGFSFELPYIGGKAFSINNNGGNVIPSEYKKTIPKLGLSRDNQTGNMIILFHVKFPEKLTPEQIESIKTIL